MIFVRKVPEATPVQISIPPALKPPLSKTPNLSTSTFKSNFRKLGKKISDASEDKLVKEAEQVPITSEKTNETTNLKGT